MPIRSYQLNTICKYLLGFAFLFIMGCKKDLPKKAAPLPPNTPVNTIADQITVTTMAIDSLDQNGFTINYTLSSTAKTSGIIFSTDSISLTTNAQGKTISRIANLTGEKKYSAYIKNPENVTNTIYWYKIYIIDNDDKTFYSNITKQPLSPYQIYSKSIVKGPYKDNNFSMDYNGLMITTTNIDLNAKNYSSTINGAQIPIAEIIHYTGTNPYNYLVFDVPSSLGLGPAVFTLSYKNNIVYSTSIIIVGGGLKFATKHPDQNPYGSHFTYNDELYFITYRDINDEVSFHKWNPLNNVWTKMRKPPSDWSIAELSTYSGHEINGVIYFPPVTFQNMYINGVRSIYNEYMYTYTPSTGAWNHIKLYQSNEPNKAISIMDCFVFNNKFYSVIQEINGDVTLDIIKEYDPSKGSWQKVMELPFVAWDCKAAVVNGEIYLLTAFASKQYSAITEFSNKFQQLDLNSKKLIDKSSVEGDGVMGTYKPYLFVYNNKIYVYGGFSYVGYVTSYNTLFAAYTPNTDKWSPVANTFNNAKVSQSDGFIVQLNGDMYIGAGYNSFSNSSSSRLNQNIYSMLLQ
jgi:hypothetical protein